MLVIFGSIFAGILIVIFFLFFQSSSAYRFIPISFLSFIGFMMGLAVSGLAKDFRMSISSTNWFVRYDRSKIHILLRYFFNRELPESLHEVIELDTTEIESARLIQEQLTVVVPHQRRSRAPLVQEFIDLTLKPQDFSTLVKKLKEEKEIIFGKGSYRGWKSKIVPVSFNEKTRILRLNWQRITPGAKNFCEALRANGVLVEESLKIDATIDKSASDDDILKLIERGRRMEAIALLRFQKDFSLKEARDFVEELAKSA